MSPTTSSRLRLRLRRARQGDGGFGLVEILVAMTVFALMTTASVPLIITGLRASTVTKMDTGAKNLAQERMESMRNLPYHVAALTATPTSQDLLDRYYPNLTAASSTSTPGFVAAGASRREGEPAGGFYRTVFDLEAEGFGNYTQYVATQFLDSDGDPLVPTEAGWNRTVEGSDNPPSLVVGVTVVTEWTVGQLSKALPLFTEIGEGRADAPIVTAVSRTTALKVSSTLEIAADDVRDLVVEAGKVSLDGSITTGTSAASSALAAYAAAVPGDRVEGATRGVSAPPTVNPVSANEPSGRVLPHPTSGVPLATFGVTRVSGVAASTAQGLPSAGLAGNQVTAAVNSGTPFTFTNQPEADTDLGIGTVAPVVRMTAPTGSGDQVSASSWFGTTTGASQAVTTHSSAAVRRLSILPTTFAPEGVIQVALRESASRCTSGPSAVEAEATYTAVVKYWDKAANGYVTVPGDSGATFGGEAALSSADTTDALAELFEENPEVDGTNRLGDYFSSMSNRTEDDLAAAASVTGERVELSLPSAVSITTRLMRDDELSAVTVDLGSFSCVAEDRR